MELRPSPPGVSDKAAAVPARPEHLRLLYRLVVAVGRAATIEDVYRTALDFLEEAVGTDRSSILTFDGQGVMRFRAWRGLSDEYRHAVDGHSPWPYGARDVSPVLVPDARVDRALASYGELFDAEGIRALAFLPLTYQGELLGKFMLYFGAPRALSADELGLAETIAAHVAFALDRARHREQARRAAVQTDRFQRLTASLAGALTPSDVVSVLVREGVEAFEAVAGCVVLVSELTGELEMAANVGFEGALVDAFRRLPLSASHPLAEAVRTRRAVLLGSPGEFQERFPELAVCFPPPPPSRQAWVAVPLVLEHRTLGAMGLAFGEVRSFGDADRELMETLASQCAQALERARLYEQERLAREVAEAAQRRLGETNDMLQAQFTKTKEAERDRGRMFSRASFLANVSRVFASSLDYETTLQSLARVLVPTFGDDCTVLLDDGEGNLTQVAEASTDPEAEALLRRLRPHYGRGRPAPPVPRQVLDSGETLFMQEIPAKFFEDIAAQSPARAELIRALGIRSLVAVPIRARGQVLGVMIFGMARSGRQIDKAVVPLAEELGERAGMAIDNARLYSEAREAVRLRDDFFSIAGHELKTPLTALGLQLVSLRRLVGAGGQPDGVKLRTKVDVIGKQVDRLGRLVDALLDVARLSAGRLQLQREQFDLAVLVEEVAARFSEEAARAGSRIHVEARGEAVGKWDRMRIDQVVTNLVSNAVKYGQGKPIEVIVEADAGGGGVRVRVRDEGIGIAPEQQARIFNRFERAVSSNHYGGLGLGLWIARQMVEAHGGAITVESGPGSSCFTVELPRRADTPATEE
jgi:signal transduction histidine kinase